MGFRDARANAILAGLYEAELTQGLGRMRGVIPDPVDPTIVPRAFIFRCASPWSAHAACCRAGGCASRGRCGVARSAAPRRTTWAAGGQAQAAARRGAAARCR
jgi:hypothetical protein